MAKTEALLVLRRARKNHLEGEIKGKNPTISVAGQDLRVVEQHKHMGSMCTSSGAMGPREWIARGQRTLRWRGVSLLRRSAA